MDILINLYAIRAQIFNLLHEFYMLYKSFEIHYKIDTTHLRDYIHFKMNKIHIMDQPYESRLNSKLAYEKSISHPPKSIGYVSVCVCVCVCGGGGGLYG